MKTLKSYLIKDFEVIDWDPTIEEIKEVIENKKPVKPWLVEISSYPNPIMTPWAELYSSMFTKDRMNFYTRALSGKIKPGLEKVLKYSFLISNNMIRFRPKEAPGQKISVYRLLDFTLYRLENGMYGYHSGYDKIVYSPNNELLYVFRKNYQVQLYAENKYPEKFIEIIFSKQEKNLHGMNGKYMLKQTSGQFVVLYTGERKEFQTGIYFDDEKITYQSVPFLDGVYSVMVPWDYNGPSIGQVMSVEDLPKEIKVKRKVKYFETEPYFVDKISTNSDIDYLGVKVDDTIIVLRKTVAKIYRRKEKPANLIFTESDLRSDDFDTIPYYKVAMAFANDKMGFKLIMEELF